MAVKFFQDDKCTRCGECLTRCRYMDLSRKEAVAEIKRLIAGEPTRTVMQKCISCMSCDAFCPYDCKPYQLILDRWDKRYRETGLPVRARYLMPYEEPSYRTDVIPSMPARERELLAKWRGTPPEGEFLYPGCNLLTTPYLFDLRVLDRLPVSGDWNLCCGEPYYRIGAFEVMEKIAAGLTDYYAGRKIERMVFVCPACLNMFRNVLNKQFGAKLDFECVYIANWLLEKMDKGELEIKKPLNRAITVHDSCHARILGDEIMKSTRDFYERLGLKVIEMKSHHEDGICCGIAAGCNRQMPQDMMVVSARELWEGCATGASEMGISCTGCYLVLNLTRNFAPTGQTLKHNLEFLAEAVGEKMERRVEKRALRITWNVMVKAFPKLLSAARYKLDRISFTPK